jgi:multidrug efflux pump subunit AcrA (membrane-fusion protein)
VYEHGARALSNAIDHNSLFLMPVWRAIGKSAWVVQARTLPKTVSIVAAVALVLVALIVVPWNYRMSAKGALEPKRKAEVFAPMPGDIIDVRIDHGSMVTKGDVLVVIRNPDLEMRVKEAEGQLSTSRETLSGLLNQLQNAGQKITDSERAKLLLDYRKTQGAVEIQDEQVRLLTARQEQLNVVAPIDGRVITWDAKRLLQNRPVETGQVLMTVAAADSDYEIKLFMPEKRSQKVAAHRDALKASDPSAELKVEYILMTEPGKTYFGKVSEVADTTESHEEHGNVVPVRVAPDEKITAGRPGATVSAYVHCGTRPLGWCLLHEAWEWLEANLFF